MQKIKGGINKKTHKIDYSGSIHESKIIREELKIVIRVLAMGEGYK